MHPKLVLTSGRRLSNRAPYARGAVGRGGRRESSVCTFPTPRTIASMSGAVRQMPGGGGAGRTWRRSGRCPRPTQPALHRTQPCGQSSAPVMIDWRQVDRRQENRPGRRTWFGADRSTPVARFDSQELCPLASFRRAGDDADCNPEGRGSAAHSREGPSVWCGAVRRVPRETRDCAQWHAAFAATRNPSPVEGGGDGAEPSDVPRETRTPRAGRKSELGPRAVERSGVEGRRPYRCLGPLPSSLCAAPRLSVHPMEDRNTAGTNSPGSSVWRFPRTVGQECGPLHGRGPARTSDGPRAIKPVRLTPGR
jgi:hypothetical protein